MRPHPRAAPLALLALAALLLVACGGAYPDAASLPADLPSLLVMPDDLPASVTAEAVSEGWPVRDGVPRPARSLHQPFAPRGGVAVWEYSDPEGAAEAFRRYVGGFGWLKDEEPPEFAGIGVQRMESGRSRLGNDGLAIDRLLLFTRCSFLVEIRLTLPTDPGRTSTDRADRAVRHYAQRLDRRLSAVFCPEP